MDNLDDKERPHYLELLRLLGEVNGWVARIDPQADPPQPAPGSPLRGDDERTHPYQLSHAAWNSLSHAVDHLNCLNALLREARQIHMYAPYSLVRAALENASAAVWMLLPAKRADRLAHRLRLATHNIRNYERTIQLMGEAGPRSEQQRIEVRDIAERAGVDKAEVARAVSYKEIVDAVGSALSAEATAITLSWRLCSGIAHADFWTLFPASDRVELPGASPGMGTFRVTASVERLMQVTSIATHMTKWGWDLYDQRSLAPY